MKWSVVGLMALGLVAAGSAALLVYSLSQRAPAMPAPPPDEKPCEDLIAVATNDLGQNDRVEAADVAMEPVRCEEVPLDAYHSSASIVGRMLARPVSKGQAVTKSCLRPDQSLDVVLPKGMRSFSLSLGAAQAGLVYPGAIVDVHAATTEGNGSEGRRSETWVAVEQAEVLGVDKETVLSPPDDNQEETRGGRYDRQRLVTLKVTTQQAKELQAIVKKNGSVWLVLRAPTDTTAIQEDDDCNVEVCRGGSCTIVRVECKRGSRDFLPVEDDSDRIAGAVEPAGSRRTGK